MAKVTKQQYTGLVKMYNSLIGSHQLWELWQDSMTMFALSISNTVDSRFREKREAAYMDIAHKYTKDEMQVFPQILGEIVMQLEAEPEQDLLGDLYMQLDLGSHWHGQFFTPYNVCSMMAKMQLGQQDYTIDNVKPITVCDCACGGGALLIAAAHEYRKAIQHTGLNAQHYISLYAQDLSQVSTMMCYVQLSLLGFAAKVKLGDSLLHPLTEQDDGPDIWYTPMWFSDIWQYRRLMQRMDKIMIGSSSADV
jgi:type I restriction-modification system DNA methylase subunit